MKSSGIYLVLISVVPESDLSDGKPPAYLSQKIRPTTHGYITIFGA